MVSGIVRRLVEIEAGSNSTESEFFLDLERRTSLYISIAFTLAVAAVVAATGKSYSTRAPAARSRQGSSRLVAPDLSPG